MRIIQVDNLSLEPQVAEHAEEMFPLLSDPAIYEFENEAPRSKEWLHNRFEKLESRRSPDGTEEWLNWVVRLPSGELAGYVQATIMPAGKALVAYELASRFWGRGIGSAAVAAMLNELSTAYSVQEFYAVLKSKNWRSLKLLRRLGFSDASNAQAEALVIEADEMVMYIGLKITDDNNTA